MKIKNVYLSKVLDSRGFYTVKSELELDSGIKASCMVPSGKSVGLKEIRCLDVNEYDLVCINEYVKHKLLAINGITQNKLDKELKDINKYFFIGGNVMLAISISFMKAKALSKKIELYQLKGKHDNNYFRLMINILNGGLHSDSNLSFQEFIIIPNFGNYIDDLNNSLRVFHNLKKLLIKNKLSTNVGDEGGFAPLLNCVEDALGYLKTSVEESGYLLGKDFYIGLDCAASEFYDKNSKKYLVDGKEYNTLELTDYYLYLINKFNIISIEDPFYEEDFLPFHKLKELSNILIVGDDLICTNYKYLKKSIRHDACNCIIIKPNQVGTVSDMEKCIKLAKENNIKIIMSHRSGETEDTFISDFSVLYNSDFVKFGSLSRTDRTCKYNRLLKIIENS